MSYAPLWDLAPKQYLVLLLIMLQICLILSLAIARPDPFFLLGDEERDRSIRPVRVSCDCTAIRYCCPLHCGPRPMSCRTTIWRMSSCSAPSPVSRCSGGA